MKAAEDHLIFHPFIHFRNIDILIGALEENLPTNQFFIASRHYYYDILTWCVQIRKRVPLWKNVLYLCCDPIAYALFAFTVVLATFLGYFMQQFEPCTGWDWNHIMITGLGTVLVGQVPFTVTTTFFRIFVISIQFGSILYTTIMSSFLIIFITYPLLNPQITSISEIFDGNFNLVGNQFAFNKISERNEVMCN